jgi:hypothetical protein
MPSLERGRRSIPSTNPTMETAMPFDDNDAAEMLQQIADLRADRDAAHQLAKRHAAEAACTRHFGDAAHLFVPAFASKLDIRGEAGEYRVIVLDPQGNGARRKIDSISGRFAAFSVDDLALEFKSNPRYQEILNRPADGDGTAGAPPVKTGSITRPPPPYTTAERTAHRALSPWRKGPHWNLTAQLQIFKRDPAFARELFLEAEGAGLGVTGNVRAV